MDSLGCTTPESVAHGGVGIHDLFVQTCVFSFPNCNIRNTKTIFLENDGTSDVSPNRTYACSSWYLHNLGGHKQIAARVLWFLSPCPNVPLIECSKQNALEKPPCLQCAFMALAESFMTMTRELYFF